MIPPKHDSPAERFARLYERNHADVLRFLLRRAEANTAEDLAHETFLIAWRRLPAVPTDSSDARAWLFTTARNCLLSSYRGEARRRALAVRLAEVGDVVRNDDTMWGTLLDLSRAWATLTSEHQEAIALAVFDGVSSREASRILGITAATYRVRLSRARTALRQASREQGVTVPSEDSKEYQR